MSIADYISVIPLAIYYGLFYLFLTNPYNNFTELFLMIYMLVCDIIVKILKQFPYPKSLHYITNRPKGASNTDYLSRNGLAGNVGGLPSGHMTSITIFSVYIIYYFLNQTKNKNIYYIIFINIILILLMAWSRHYKKCHNIFQIICGIIFGFIMGIIFIYIINYLKKNKENRI